MKRLAFLLLITWVDLVCADPVNPCNAPTTLAKTPYVDLSATAAGFDCAPTPVGNGTLPTLRSNNAGTVAWWYCPSREGKWHLNWTAATAAKMSASNLLAEAYAVVGAADPKAAFRSVMAQNVKVPLSDPSLTPVWCPFFVEMSTGGPAAQIPRNPAAASTPQPSRR